ncbi:MAG: hypothetical protein CM1200mP16_03230 [Nitrospina sp.]|nr:MAG: hypothetical protein CM1200mP16_03230 [Nitrospina sp.]
MPFLNLGKMEEAEAVYKNVLTLDSSDMDAKFNLEFVREQLKKKKNQEKENNKSEHLIKKRKNLKNKKIKMEKTNLNPMNPL